MMANSSLRACRIGVLFSAALLIAHIAPLTADEPTCDNCERIDRHACAGWPQCISRWARPSYGCHETGYYVGGGAAAHGDCRCPHEGTWGWDYHGRLFTKRIALGWHHGRRDQGGYGAYKTDGPHLLHH